MPRRSLWRILRAALVTSALLAAGCGVSPPPEPPSITIDVSHIDLGAGADGGATLTGKAGAVKPGGGSLSALDLDVVTPEISVTVAADGSFQAKLGGATNDVYRLQASLDAGRSDPVDVTGAMGFVQGPAQTVAGPLAGCFSIDPALEVDVAAGATVPISLHNGCADPVTVSGFPLRAGSPSWSVAAPAVPLTMPAGGTSSVSVTFDPAAGGAAEDVLFVQIAAPETGRRPLTLRGESP